MNRRKFGLLAGTSALGLMSPVRSFAQSANAAQLLSTTLTPMGSERAGNAAGTIPAWTGGFTTVPADWDPTSQMVPDFWAGEAPLYTVNASNMSQYSALLCDGVKHLMQNSGYSIKVYPTHRTAASPQWVYDNIAANATRAQLDPAGGRLGFTGGYGGIPFPIPDTSDPLAGGAQLIWNHITRWLGVYETVEAAAYTVIGGQVILSNGGKTQAYWPYYDPNGSLATYAGYQFMNHTTVAMPAASAGTEIIDRYATNPNQNPNILWELLLGQGRVRKAPELSYDTPAFATDGLSNYDEYYGFNGAPNQYDWKLIGKREFLIPYNNNQLRRTPADIAHAARFINPDVTRWELHRVWVVEATLHPGQRNVLARRMLYIDEDTWTIAFADSWDGNGDLYKMEQVFNYVFPNLPGTILLNTATYNLQTGNYCTQVGPWGNPPFNRPENFAKIDLTTFEPQVMAANASY